MDGKRHLLVPQKRANEGSYLWRINKRTPDFSGEIVYKLQILLPNEMTILVKIPKGTESISCVDLTHIVKQKCDRAIQAAQTSNPKKNVRWDADLRFIDDYGHVFKNFIKLTRLQMNRVYNLRLDDGSQPATIYENTWDLTIDREFLMELPEEYTFEIVLADLLDNSLPGVWATDEYEKRLISVEVSNEKISIFDTGLGMDSTSIEKWGKMGASLHRAYNTQAIGDKPPYLKPAFGMFGYGGYIAFMHLGRRIKVSSKTKIGQRVSMLRLERDALVSSSVSSSKATWRTYRGVRDQTHDELELSPFGSFTKVEIFEPNLICSNIRRLKCMLKDIYYPYIQCDNLPGRTAMPIKFQVNGEDLAEISGGEVAITNLASCVGPEFILQVRFKLIHTMESSQGSSEEANARLRCVYLPVKEGKESIERVLDALKEDGYNYIEEFRSFMHVSCRRLGRLLPDARWAWLPFMDLRQRKTDRSQAFLMRSCMRVKCFIETDAGFSPTPSKTDFAHQSPFTTALRNLGSKQSPEKDSGVDIDIRRDGKSLNLTQLDKQYQLWLREMHERYDEEDNCGIAEPVLIDSGKCLAVDDFKLNNQIEKQYQKIPSSMEILNTRHCGDLGIESVSVELLTEMEPLEDLWNEIIEIGLRIGKLEPEIKKLVDEQKTIEFNLSECEGIRDSILSISRHGSPGKNKITERVESKADSSGSLVPATNQLSENDTPVLKRYRELKLKLNETIAMLDQNRKSHASDLKTFYERRDLYRNSLMQLPPIGSSSSPCSDIHPENNVK